jgi:phage I-like protein
MWIDPSLARGMLARHPRARQACDMLCKRTHALALAPNTEGELPTEFRIFAAGEIATSEGPDLFDAEAARLVMAEYVRQGTDVIVDLEHDSLSKEARTHRADAADARGRAALELRNGELWAVNVRWSPDGARRLREGTQPYLSPAFTRDPKTRRITSLVNLAMVSMPATYNATELSAAGRLLALSKIDAMLAKYRSAYYSHKVKR